MQFQIEISLIFQCGPRQVISRGHRFQTRKMEALPTFKDY